MIAKDLVHIYEDDKAEIKKSVLNNLTDEQLKQIAALTTDAKEIISSKKSTKIQLVELKALNLRAQKLGLHKTLMHLVHKNLWTNRGWAFRLAACSAAVGATGASAGLAAFGGAVSVPLIVVGAAFGSLAGMVLEEALKLLASRQQEFENNIQKTPLIENKKPD